MIFGGISDDIWSADLFYFQSQVLHCSSAFERSLSGHDFTRVHSGLLICISRLHFSSVFVQCISQSQVLHCSGAFERSPSRYHFNRVHSGSHLYLSTVFLISISQLYFKMLFLQNVFLTSIEDQGKIKINQGLPYITLGPFHC